MEELGKSFRKYCSKFFNCLIKDSRLFFKALHNISLYMFSTIFLQKVFKNILLLSLFYFFISIFFCLFLMNVNSLWQKMHYTVNPRLLYSLLSHNEDFTHLFDFYLHKLLPSSKLSD